MGIENTYLFNTEHGCGRYVLINGKKIWKRFDAENKPFDIKPNYNVAPTQIMPVITQRTGKKRVELMRWGVIPIWAKDKPGFGYHTFNAKAETLEEKPMWKSAFKKRRCLVPFEAYYEWKKIDGKNKQPYLFKIGEMQMFAFAGLFDEWVDEKSGESFKSYTIITTKPNVKQARIHDRMPVILDKSEELQWLNETQDDMGFLETLLNPYTGRAFGLYKVDSAVGNSRNNEKDLIMAIE